MHLKVMYFINVPCCNANLQAVINRPRRRPESISSQLDLRYINTLNEASEEKEKAAGGKK